MSLYLLISFFIHLSAIGLISIKGYHKITSLASKTFMIDSIHYKNSARQKTDRGKIPIRNNGSKKLLASQTVQTNDLFTHPSELESYLEQIRTQIKSQLKNTDRYSGFFVLKLKVLSSGNLDTVQVLKSEGPKWLEQHVLDSLQKTAPFPEFPVEIKRLPELSFILPIQFNE